MRIPIDRHSKTPLYRQVQDYLHAHILSGQLVPGTRLPATRKLAEELGLSRITIQNAYANLESEALIANVEGSGAYVLPPLHASATQSEQNPPEWPLWQQTLSCTAENEPSAILAATNNPQTISFTGVGDPRHFPIKDFQRSLRAVLHNEGTAVLEYSESTAGYLPLRETIAHILASQGIQTYPDHVLITSGSQQALALVCQVLLKPGDVVLVEKPTYNMALDLFRALHLNIVGVTVDADGLQVELLEPLLQQYHPKLLYTIPNFQNPSGVCMTGARRRRLIALAERYNLPILEDDFVGDLRYNGHSQPAIKALDPNGNVVYGGTFSKILMPGLRVGYVVADGPLFGCLAQMKQVTDLNTSTLIQHAVNEYITVGRYQTHLRRSTRRYRQRRNAMLAAIKRHLPAEVEVIPPQGGLFVWLRLPPTLSALDLWPLAADVGVTFAPGPSFFPDPKEGASHLRLNFATQTLEDIDEGIRRLGVAVERLT